MIAFNAHSRLKANYLPGGVASHRVEAVVMAGSRTEAASKRLTSPGATRKAWRRKSSAQSTSAPLT